MNNTDAIVEKIKEEIDKLEDAIKTDFEMKGVDNNIKIFEIETDTKYFRSMCHGYIEKIIGIVLDKYIKE